MKLNDYYLVDIHMIGGNLVPWFAASNSGIFLRLCKIWSLELLKNNR